MKKTLLTLGLIAFSAAHCFSQGSVYFSNLGGGVVAPITDAGGTRLAGTGFTAELWTAATGVVDPSAFAPVAGSAGPFDSGNFAGFILNRTSPIVVAGVAIDQTANFLVRAWDNQGGSVTSWDNAIVRGESEVLTAVGALKGAQAPDVPVLTGLATFAITPVPEPSVIALGLVGAGLLWFRRKK
jgi:hypothetical protein